MQLTWIWFQFFIASLVVVVSGIKLTKYGDMLADKTSLSRGWIGVIILATATSLPELVTSFSSVLWVREANLAVGNVLGSNMFNVMILGILDILAVGYCVFREAQEKDMLPAIFSILLTTIVLFGMHWELPKILHFSPFSLILFILYCAGIYWIFRLEHGQHEVLVDKEEEEHTSLRTIIVWLSVAGLFIVGSGMWMVYSADAIAKYTALDASFIGSLFMAAATSLPELVVAISALRLNQIEMAFGDVFGSNMFNMMIIPLCDFVLGSANIFRTIDAKHTYSALIGIALCTVFIIAALLRNFVKKRFPRFSVVGASIFILYFVGMYLSFTK